MKCSRNLKSGSTFLQMIQIKKEICLLSKKHQSSDRGAFYIEKNGISFSVLKYDI